jgi:hypothetical protein
MAGDLSCRIHAGQLPDNETIADIRQCLASEHEAHEHSDGCTQRIALAIASRARRAWRRLANLEQCAARAERRALNELCRMALVSGAPTERWNLTRGMRSKGQRALQRRIRDSTHKACSLRQSCRCPAALLRSGREWQRVCPSRCENHHACAPTRERRLSARLAWGGALLAYI